MALDLASERVCYVHCNFCNTILAVNVPSSSLFTIVTVRCGHCANLLSVNMEGASLQAVPLQLQDPQKLQLFVSENLNKQDCGSSSSRCNNKVTSFQSAENDQPPRMPPIRLIRLTARIVALARLGYKHKRYKCKAAVDEERLRNVRILPYSVSFVNENRAPEKRQRVPSAYNRFIKEEIQRIKASNPDISHREAFSTAAKNWAHFPHIHFGLKLDANNKHAKLDHHQSFAGDHHQHQATPKPTGLYEINGTL